ncbi:hypothetical protein [Peribacillus sp. JNUCC41]|uniref:hypothetical protein n=1 Tax=Peribacillus sp. JNUCC41 TaxID=2778370 RepID=UPI00177C9531|nr:hypothetical protein [Brevibacillus sp. JNUCC-41]QOS88754.1 hypothetical protein JNUCC41_18295 [Brevibacillus sp. JNUCC-41]
MRKILFFLLLIGFPIVLTLLLRLSIFRFAPGQVDSWIAFWGSYVGAIIGASVVYFVAKLQIGKQYEQQIKSIKLENEHSISREMEQFLITTRLGKYEKTIKVCEKLSNLTIELNNEFVKYVTYTDIINNKEDPDRENDFKEKIYAIRTKHSEFHALIILNTTELMTLSNYSPDIKDYCTKLTWKLNGLWAEAKGCYYSKDEYKNYLKPNEQYLLKDAEFILSTLLELIKELNNKINSELIKIEKKIL